MNGREETSSVQEMREWLLAYGQRHRYPALSVVTSKCVDGEIIPWTYCIGYGNNQEIYNYGVSGSYPEVIKLFYDTLNPKTSPGDLEP